MGIAKKITTAMSEFNSSECPKRGIIKNLFEDNVDAGVKPEFLNAPMKKTDSLF